MFKKLYAVIITSLFLLTTSTSYAQEANRYDENAKWMEIVKITFKIGKREAAMAIIEDYFKPATAKAKIPHPEMLLELQTGDYDLILIWHMKNGVSDMTWETSPQDAAWIKAITEISGSREKTQSILDEYFSYIDKAENNIAIVNP